jgi:hypothetical protein
MGETGRMGRTRYNVLPEISAVRTRYGPPTRTVSLVPAPKYAPKIPLPAIGGACHDVAVGLSIASTMTLFPSAPVMFAMASPTGAKLSVRSPEEYELLIFPSPGVTETAGSAEKTSATSPVCPRPVYRTM